MESGTLKMLVRAQAKYAHVLFTPRACSEGVIACCVTKDVEGGYADSGGCDEWY